MSSPKFVAMAVSRFDFPGQIEKRKSVTCKLFLLKIILKPYLSISNNFKQSSYVSKKKIKMAAMKTNPADLCCRVMQATVSNLLSDSLHQSTNFYYTSCIIRKVETLSDVILRALFFGFSPISHGTNKDIPVEIYNSGDIESLKSSGFSKACDYVCKWWWRYICYACPIGTHVKPGGKECIDCSAGQLHWITISCLD